VTERELGALLNASGPDGPCPAAETLAALVSGAIDPAERHRVLEHVSTCADCQADMRAALATAPWAERASALIDGPGRTAGAPLPARARIWSGAALLAASFALAAAGAVAWGVWQAQDRARLAGDLASARAGAARAADLEAQIADANRRLAAAAAERRMALNTPIVDLLPAATRGGGGSVLNLTPEASLVTVIVTLPLGTAPGTPLAIEVFDAARRSLGRWSGLRASPAGTCTFTIAAAALPTGTVHFRVIRDTADAPVVHNYELEVRR
jgi:hypothetical protein